MKMSRSICHKRKYTELYRNPVTMDCLTIGKSKQWRFTRPVMVASAFFSIKRQLTVCDVTFFARTGSREFYKIVGWQEQWFCRACCLFRHCRHVSDVRYFWYQGETWPRGTFVALYRQPYSRRSSPATGQRNSRLQTSAKTPPQDLIYRERSVSCKRPVFCTRSRTWPMTLVNWPLCRWNRLDVELLRMKYTIQFRPLWRSNSINDFSFLIIPSVSFLSRSLSIIDESSK